MIISFNGNSDLSVESIESYQIYVDRLQIVFIIYVYFTKLY